jgi:hypothetical protein
MPQRGRYRVPAGKSAEEYAAKVLFGEMQREAKTVARALGLTGQQPDAEAVQDDEYYEMIRSNWEADPVNYPKTLLARYIGSKSPPEGKASKEALDRYAKDVQRAFPQGFVPPPPPLPPAPLPMPPVPGGAPPIDPLAMAEPPMAPPPLPPEGMGGIDPFGFEAPPMENLPPLPPGPPTGGGTMVPGGVPPLPPGV